MTVIAAAASAAVPSAKAPDANAAAAAPGFAGLAGRADAARAEIARADQATRDLLMEATDAIRAFNRAGLVTLVRALRADPRGAELLYAAMDQPEVMALLVGHDIVRADLAVEVLAALERIRPHLVSSGVTVELGEIDGDVAYLRFSGSGCESPAADLVDAVLDAILERVPGLREVVEMPPEPGDLAFIPLGALRIGPPAGSGRS